jgi:hypothetical protein
MAIKSFYSKVDETNSVIESMIIGKSDQRGFLRMGVESKISFKVVGSKTVYEGISKDLSATGMRFISKQKVNVGDMLEVTMKPGIDITPPLITTIAVVRVIENDDGEYDIAGVMQQAESN